VSPPLPANEQTAFGYIGSKNVNNYKVVSIPAAPIDWNQKSQASSANVSQISAVGCDGEGISVLPGFNDWANFHFNLRASLEFAGGGDTEQAEVTSENDILAFLSLDSDGSGKGDGLDCSNNPDQGIPPTNFYCVADAKPGDAFNIVNLSINPGSTGGGELKGTLPFALLGSANFTPGTVVNRLSLTLRGESELVGHPVDKKGNGDANCTTGNLSGPAFDPVFGVPVGNVSVPDGFTDLICKFSGLRFDGPGSYYVILEGALNDGRKIRAHDVVNVK
jgi:hypothetical protein